MIEDIPCLTDEMCQSNLPFKPTDTCLVFYIQLTTKSEIKYSALKSDRNFKTGAFPALAGLQAVLLWGKEPSGKI